MSETTARILRLVAISGAATAVLLSLRFGADTTDRFIADVGAISAYVTAIGTLYSILAAFTIYVVWTQFNDTATAIREEAKDLLDMYRYVAYLNDGPAAEGFRSAIVTYTSLVAEDEWGAMSRGQSSRAAEDAFEGIFREINAVKFDDDRDESAWTMIIQKFENVSDSRTKRLELASADVPLLLYSLLYGVSVALVAGFFMLGIDNDFLAVTTTVLTTTIVVLVIDAVADMDDPFGGQWGVTPAAFEAVPQGLATIDAVVAA